MDAKFYYRGVYKRFNKIQIKYKGLKITVHGQLGQIRDKIQEDYIISSVQSLSHV